MEKFVLYLGLNDKESKTQKISTLDAYHIVTNLISKQFEGGTISEAHGIYKHDNGTIVIETTFRIELLMTTEKNVRKFVETLKTIFNQESVAVQKQVINSELW